MPLELKQHENVLFPMPYVPTEANLFIVTNQRVVHYGERGHQEIPSSEVTFVGRMMTRPRVVFGVILLTAALPLFIVAIWQVASVWNMEAAPILSLFSSSDTPDDQAAAPPPEGEEAQPNYPRDVLKVRILAVLLAITGAGLALGGFKLVRKKSYFVLCRGGTKVIKVQAADQIQQTQILATIDAVKGKARAPAAKK